MDRHFPACGLRRSAAGGPGDGRFRWRLGAWTQRIPLASPRAEESSSHGNGLFGCGTNGHACPTGAGASAAVLRLGGHLVHAIAAGGLPGSWPGSLIAGQAAAPPGAWAAVTPKPPPLPAATLAGHPSILKIDTAGQVAERIGRGAYPLGVKAGLSWETVHGTLAPGERLLLHSDGLTEARNAQEREFGDHYVEVIAGWHPDGTASTLVDSLVGEWQMFMGHLPADDDVSITVVRRR